MEGVHHVLKLLPSLPHNRR